MRKGNVNSVEVSHIDPVDFAPPNMVGSGTLNKKYWYLTLHWADLGAKPTASSRSGFTRLISLQPGNYLAALSKVGGLRSPLAPVFKPDN